MSIKYVRNEFPAAVYSVKRVNRRGIMGLAPGQSADGYGRKIATDYMVAINGKKYRIYATCISNSASHWIMIGKETYHVGDFDIPDEVRNQRS